MRIYNLFKSILFCLINQTLFLTILNIYFYCFIDRECKSYINTYTIPSIIYLHLLANNTLIQLPNHRVLTKFNFQTI